MCKLVTCQTCGKPTWAGCGQHIEQTMAGIPVEARCSCREKKAGSSPVPPRK